MALSELAKLLNVSERAAAGFVECLQVWTSKGQTVEQAIASHMATMTAMVNKAADFAAHPTARAFVVDAFFPGVGMIAAPSYAQAVAYVLGVEAKWNYSVPGQVLRTEDITDSGHPMVRVLTADADGPRNDWAVWFQPDGTLYGEC